VPSVSLLALDKIPKSILCRMPAAGHSAKYLNPFFAECQIVGTRQSIFKKKIFAECRIAGTRQRTLTYLAEPLPHSSLLSVLPVPPPLSPLIAHAAAVLSPCPLTPRWFRARPRHRSLALPADAATGNRRPHPSSLVAPSTAVARALHRRPHPPSPCPAVARALARHRTRLQSRFHPEFSEFYIVICDLVIFILYCWRLVLKCYELRTRQHKNRLMVNALRPSKHYFPKDITIFGRRL
jgi:hypothetical protein